MSVPVVLCEVVFDLIRQLDYLEVQTIKLTNPFKLSDEVNKTKSEQIDLVKYLGNVSQACRTMPLRWFKVFRPRTGMRETRTLSCMQFSLVAEALA
jgi:hypothetical protein